MPWALWKAHSIWLKGGTGCLQKRSYLPQNTKLEVTKLGFKLDLLASKSCFLRHNYSVCQRDKRTISCPDPSTLCLPQVSSVPRLIYSPSPGLRLQGGPVSGTKTADAPLSPSALTGQVSVQTSCVTGTAFPQRAHSHVGVGLAGIWGKGLCVAV